MQHFICSFEIKSQPDDNTGIITGYGSVFGNIDSYGDIVARGAFAKSIAAVNSGAVAWPANVIATWWRISDR
jgi:phage head maturation protease